MDQQQPQQQQQQEKVLTKSSVEVILSPPTLLDKIVDDPRCPSVGSLTHSGYINAMHPSGPQLCYSPCINPGYSSLGEINPDIQFSGDEGGDEDDSGSSRVEETKVYTRRWYVLFLYCLIAATQGGIWNVFGPIAATTEDIFGWNDGTIALLTNWGPISYLLAGVYFSWMMDVKGLRMACVMSAVLTAVGAALKCFVFTTPWVTVLAHIAQFLNGLAGPVAMAAPPILSAVWFPPKERTTATAIGTIFNAVGMALSFIMGPLLVPDVTNSTTTMSGIVNGSVTEVYTISPSESIADRVDHEKKGFALYMYIAAGWSALLLIMFIVYFPSKPPLPPCPSATIPRENFLKGLKHLMTRKQFFLVAFIYGVSSGTLGCWGSVLDVILKPYGISQYDAGWLGFYSTCSCCMASLIVARFADFFKRTMKLLILISYTIGTGALIVFTLGTINIIPASNALFYSTIIVGNTAINAAVPLIFELACELSYPTGEGITNGVLTIFNNFFGLIFLFIMMVPNIGTQWTNWMIVGTSGICLPLLFLMKEQYNRLAIDEHNPKLGAQITVPPPS